MKEHDFDFVPDFEKLDELDHLPSIVENKPAKKAEREWVKIIQLSGEFKNPYSRHAIVELETENNMKYVSITDIAYDEYGDLCKIVNTEFPIEKWDEVVAFIQKERKFERE